VPSDLSLTGRAVGGVPAAFTVGGWLRLTPQQSHPASTTVFGSTSQFQIPFDDQGILSAAFVEGQGSVISDVSLNDGNWHYVAVSYLENALNPNNFYFSSGVLTPPRLSTLIYARSIRRPGPILR
jgi:hypothetical protein